MGGVAPGLFAGVVQYNQDNRAFEGATHTNITIDVVCETLQSGSDPLTQWGVLNTMLTDGQCTAFNYSEMIMAMRDTSLTAPAAEGGRQWTYQTCAEFGFYQTTDGEKQPFGSYLPLDFSIQQCVACKVPHVQVPAAHQWPPATPRCEDIFGTMFDQSFIQDRVDFTLAHYGGRDLLGTKYVAAAGPWVSLCVRVVLTLSAWWSSIIIPAGAIDPWHALEVLTPNPAYNITTILIDDGAHCSNMCVVQCASWAAVEFPDPSHSAGHIHRYAGTPTAPQTLRRFWQLASRSSPRSQSGWHRPSSCQSIKCDILDNTHVVYMSSHRPCGN